MEANNISFIKRPEGKIGALLPLLVIVPIIYFFGGAIGNYIVNAVDNIVHLAIVGGLVLLAGWILIDPKFRMAVMFLYLSLLRIFFTFDPLGNLKSIRTRFMQRLEQFTNSLGQLRGQRIKTQRSYDAAAASKAQELSYLAAANKSGKQLQIQLCSNNINRFQETMSDDSKQLKLYDILIERLSRGHELCTFKIEDMKQEINHREKQMEDAKISRSIVQSAMGILRGNGMEQDVWESSNRQIENEYTAALGEVDNLLDLTKGIFDKADLLQEAHVQSALTQLDAWNAKNEVNMSGNRQLPAPSPVITIGNERPSYSPVTAKRSSGDDDYEAMLK